MHTLTLTPTLILALTLTHTHTLTLTLTLTLTHTLTLTLTQERETREAARATGRKDFQGVWRGHCLQCNSCSCYAKPIGLGRASRHWQYCAVCGCLAETHDERGVVDRA